MATVEHRRARCPTCRARRKESTVCHRCGSDLSQLQAIEARADRYYDSARRAYRSGFFRNAASRAAAASRLEASEETLRLLAVAAIRSGDFLTGVNVARRLMGDRTEEVGDAQDPATPASSSAAFPGFGPSGRDAYRRSYRAFRWLRRTLRRDRGGQRPRRRPRRNR